MDPQNNQPTSNSKESGKSTTPLPISNSNFPSLSTPTDSSTSSPSTPSPILSSSPSVFQKCKVCNKKVMFYNKCKCQDLFCSKHMLDHQCTFDHHGHHKKILEKRNPKIESEKLIQL
jgi:hypothetical protein